MKRLFIGLVVLILIIPTSSAKANRVESVEIEVLLHRDGSASINDTRTFTALEGSEFYISHWNLDGIDLVDYGVYDHNGNELERLDQWDSYLTREEKAGKYGLIDLGDGFEIVVGYGDYGSHTYTFSYSLSNFVFNLLDGHQAFYWTFIKNFNADIGKVNISIKNDFAYDFLYPETRLWGFGYEGQIEINEDRLVSYNNKAIGPDDYLVLLGIFQGSPFLSQSEKNMTSQDLIDMALDGTEKINPYLLRLILGFFVFLAFIVIHLIRSSKNYLTGVHKDKYKKPRDLNYYREIPYKSFIRTAYLVDAKNDHILSAYILKWVLSDRVLYIKDLDTKKKTFEIRLDQGYEPTNINEKRLWDIFLKSANSKKVISQDSLVNYAKENPIIYKSFFDKVNNNSRNYLKDKGYYEIIRKKNFGKTRTIYTLTKAGKDLGDKIYGFEKYLKDFSIINERYPSEVKLWEDYLVWASFLGIADRVYKELSLVDPSIGQSHGNLTKSLKYIGIISRQINNNYHKSYSRLNARSGRGGRSFRSGGGGSFGGGGGGFR